MGTIVASKGHADGITRAVTNFQRYAALNRSDVVYAVYDPSLGVFYELNIARLPQLLSGARVDLTHLPDPFARKPRLRERFPPPLKRLALNIQRPRRRAFLLTERIRLSRTSPSPFLARIQEWLLTDKYRAELSDGSGNRRTLFPFDMVFTRRLTTNKDDIALFLGAEFPSMQQCCAHSNRPNSPRIVVMCQDIIPLMFPQFYKEQDRQRFGACFHAVFPNADLTIFSTKRVENDVKEYCAQHGLNLRDSAVVPLGSTINAVPRFEETELPYALTLNKFALFVSTIEPRKNHRLLFDTWKALLREGIPQKQDFKLVFVGRPGWLVDDFISELKADPSYQKSLLVLSDVNDAALHQLYTSAAFCLYPSLYEGFGLPVVEAFRHGKAVIASTGGALPEVVQDFSPTLDPHDVEGWCRLMKTWMEDPTARAVYEQRIRDDFRLRDWDAASKDLFDAIDRKFGIATNASATQ